MASPPEADFSVDGHSCLSFLHDHDGDQQSTHALNFQGRNHHRMDRSAMKETEDLLASELNKLSVQERSKALDDVHCVGEELRETPEMIERALAEFDEMVKTTASQIYTMAVNQNRSYVEDRSLRLKFLRANMFNVRKSVHQMMSFLRQKALYFGEANITDDVGPENLNREEIALMRSGFFEILKDRDPSGRVILYNSSRDRIPANCKLETMIHVMYHIIFKIILSIPTAQTKGVVVIYYDESKGEADKVLSHGLTFIAKSCSFADTLPLRVSSLHVCVHSSPGSLTLHNKIAQAGLKALSARALTRSRLHYGSDMERQYQLRSFGIPLDNFPVDKNGNMRAEINRAWCDEYLENVISSIDEQPMIENPVPHNMTRDGIRETDVLFGRGRMLQNHAGNVRFREFLDTHIEEDESLPRTRRNNARIGCTKELMSSGVRFMRQTETGLWVECDFKEAVEKVGQFFRTRRRRRRQREAGI